MTNAEDRYRTLLDASSTLADQPTVKAVLHSLRGVLSSTSSLHGTELYVLNDEQDSLHVLEFDRDPDAPASRSEPKCYELAQWRGCLRNRNQFSSRTYRRKC